MIKTISYKGISKKELWKSVPMTKMYNFNKMSIKNGKFIKDNFLNFLRFFGLKSK